MKHLFRNNTRRFAGSTPRLIAVLLLGFFARQATATPIQYDLSVDDYGSLIINGSLVASYDAYPWGEVSGSIDLAPGWYTIDLTYKNRWGTSALRFYERADSQDPWEYVPLSHLRSYDASGALVEGLRADYYELGGQLLGSIYGEGPIAHGWSDMYEGLTGQSGGPIVDTYWRANWLPFEEHLTGEIYVSGASVPEPAPLALVGLGLGILALIRKVSSSIG